jgi:serine/threonine protein kinase
VTSIIIIRGPHYIVLEWIPYNKFYDIEYIAKGGFGKVYKAKWIDGYIHHWDTNENQNWKRFNSNEFVALKSLNNSENVTLEFINEVQINFFFFYLFNKFFKCYFTYGFLKKFIYI